VTTWVEAAPETVRPSKGHAAPALNDLLRRVEGEYREMPGLSLTPRQAERLWGLDCATCGVVLAMLTERQVLRRTTTGVYLRGPAG
jgi:hypothetical protein